MKVEERFLKYVGFETSSYEDSATVPSSEKEWALAKYLEQELKSIGLSDVKLSDKCYVYGKLPASEGCEKLPRIGFAAHMDVSPAASGKDIKPRIVDYKGGDIQLSEDVSTKEKDFKVLKKFIGQHLIVTDGTTLLGADDKAGIAEIFTAFEYLIAHPEIRHGQLSVCITPDEEIGRGPDFFDYEEFACDFAYTLDGGLLGSLEYENFNAAAAKITVKGLSIHPGSAKNKMKNANLIACEYIGMLPPAQRPEYTEKYEGFYHVDSITGSVEKAGISMIIRDHDIKKFEERKRFAADIAEYLNKKYGEGTVTAQITDSYFNMKEAIKDKMYVVDRAKNAMKELGIEPLIYPIRGGTDGATLTNNGLPCPNLCTGGANFHGVHELVSIEAMEKCVQLVIEIAKA